MPNPSFLIHICQRDWIYGLELLGQIRKLYPEAKITLISDGMKHPEIDATAEALNARYCLGNPLKRELSHDWSNRFFQLALQLPEPVIKVDADMWLNRAIDIPGGAWDIACDDHIGSPVIGGCLILWHGTIRRLQEFCKRAPAEAYEIPQYGEFYCQDKMLRQAIEELGLKAVEIPNAKIQWADPVENPQQYAVFGPRLSTLEYRGQRCRLMKIKMNKVG